MIPCRIKPRDGYTLIVVIGVIGVLSILSAVILPDMIKLAKTDYREVEKNNLWTLAMGLERHIVLNNTIPDSSQQTDNGIVVPAWDSAIALQVNISQNDVSVNETGGTRFYVLEPGGNPAVPYAQTSASANMSAGVRPRMVIVSSVGTQPTKFGGGATLTSGHAPTASDFDELWDWDGQSAVLDLTAAQATTDLSIQRIDTSHLFYTITLKNDAESKVDETGNAFFDDPDTFGTSKTVLMIPAQTRVRQVSFKCDTGSSVNFTIEGSNGTQYYSGGAKTCDGTTDNISWSGTQGLASPNTITVSLTSGVSASDVGYVTVTVNYDANVSYQLDTTTAVALNADTNVTLYILQGTRLTMLDNSGATSHVMFTNDSDGFRYLPGLAGWRRSGVL